MAAASIAADREKERLAHSILYNESTSELKDDIPQLLECWKGQGLSSKSSFLLGRTEAGFLLWYHALESPESMQEMFDNNAVGITMLVLDHHSVRIGRVTDTDRTIASALLRLLVENEEFRDKLLSAKGHDRQGFDVLTEALGNLVVGQERVAGVLRLLSETPKTRGRILINHGPIYWKSFTNVIGSPHNTNELAKTELAFFLRYMPMGNPEIKEEIMQASAVRALLEMLGCCKTESALNAAAGCLYRLTEAEPVMERLAEEGGIKLLADLVSAPPRYYINAARDETARRTEEAKLEEEAARLMREDLAKAISRREQERQRAEQLKKGKEREKLERETARLREAEEAASGRSKRGSRTAGGGLPAIKRAGKTKGIGARKASGVASESKDSGEEEESFAMPRIDIKYIPTTEVAANLPRRGEAFPPHVVGTNSLCVSWKRTLRTQTKGYACAILYALSLKDYHCMTLDSCAVTYRLCNFLCSILAPPEPAKGGKGMKKDKKEKRGKPAKLKLSQDEEDALLAATGCLRHLTTSSDSNKARIVKYGAVPGIIQLYSQTSRHKVRWNCRGVLSAVGCLHENGQALDATGMFPEEFLVYDPMHLRRTDMSELQEEFRAEDLAKNPPASAAQGK